VLTAQEREAIARIRQSTKAQLDLIAANPRLTAGGKRAHRARVQRAAERAAREICDTSDAREAQARQDAYFRAFGLRSTDPSAVVADRDARSLAEGIKTPAEALKQLGLAELRGDTSLARAISEKAWRMRTGPNGKHWEKVVGAYADGAPDRNADLGELASYEHTTTEKFGDRIARTIPRPPDLQRGDFDQIASDAEAAMASGEGV